MGKILKNELIIDKELCTEIAKDIGVALTKLNLLIEYEAGESLII